LQNTHLKPEHKYTTLLDNFPRKAHLQPYYYVGIPEYISKWRGKDLEMQAEIENRRAAAK
jgi:hypothetical protein